MANKEKKSWLEKAAELSKKLDKAGIVTGLALIAFGTIKLLPAFVTGGVVLAGTSAVTYVIGEEVRRSAERKRKAKQAQALSYQAEKTRRVKVDKLVYQYKSSLGKKPVAA